MSFTFLSASAKVDYPNGLYHMSATATGCTTSDTNWHSYSEDGWFAGLLYNQPIQPYQTIGYIANSLGEYIGQAILKPVSSHTYPLFTGATEDPQITLYHGKSRFGLINQKCKGVKIADTTNRQLMVKHELAFQSGYLMNNANYPENIAYGIYAWLPYPEYTQHYYEIDSNNTPVYEKVPHYSGVPVQFVAGDGVLNAYVLSQVSGNKIRWTNPTVGTLAADYTNALVTSVYGSATGQTARVTSYNHSLNEFTIDTTGSFASNYVTVAPRRIITDYSGWNFIRKPKVEFTLDKAYDKGIGDYTGAVQYIGHVDASLYFWMKPAQALDAQVENGLMYGVSGAAVAVPYDDYGRAPSQGDVLYMQDINNATGPASGVLVLGLGNQVIPGTYTVQYIPQNFQPAAAPYDNFTLHRNTIFNLDVVPSFGEQLQVHITTTPEGAVDRKTAIAAAFTAPTAKLLITSNDYDSTYGTVTDTSHFHIGPILLSDGTVLDSSKLYLSGSLKSSDPRATTALQTWNMFGSQSPTAGANYNGQYYKDGVFVLNYNQAFTTPDMLLLDAEVGYYSAKIKVREVIPVQPPI